MNRYCKESGTKRRVKSAIPSRAIRNTSGDTLTVAMPFFPRRGDIVPVGKNAAHFGIIGNLLGQHKFYGFPIIEPSRRIFHPAHHVFRPPVGSIFHHAIKSEHGWGTPGKSLYSGQVYAGKSQTRGLFPPGLCIHFDTGAALRRKDEKQRLPVYFYVTGIAEILFQILNDAFRIFHRIYLLNKWNVPFSSRIVIPTIMIPAQTEIIVNVPTGIDYIQRLFQQPSTGHIVIIVAKAVYSVAVGQIMLENQRFFIQ